MPLTKVGVYDASAQAEITKSDPWQGSFTPQAGDFAPTPSLPAFYLVQKGTAAAITLAAPVAAADDYKCVGFMSDTAAAHVITATGLLQTGSAAVNTATCAAQIGCNVIFMAWQGKWRVVSQIGITFA